MKYDELEKLNALRQSGAITDEEYEAEKKKILNGGNVQRGQYWGMDERKYAMLLHWSQLLNVIAPSLGLLMPVIMWLIYKDENQFINSNGRMAVNWVISNIIYYVILIPLCFIFIGIPFVVVLGILDVVFCIIAGIKASEGTVWKYPLSFNFLG